jgi:hypothetical protein
MGWAKRKGCAWCGFQRLAWVGGLARKVDGYTVLALPRTGITKDHSQITSTALGSKQMQNTRL